MIALDLNYTEFNMSVLLEFAMLYTALLINIKPLY